MAPPTGEPTATGSHLRINLPDFETDHNNHNCELNVVFASVGCSNPKIVNDLLPKIADIPDVSLRAILDGGFRSHDFIGASSYALTMKNVARTPGKEVSAEDVEKEAAEWCEWANLLVLAPIDAGNLAKMLHGHTDNLLLEILRSWNVSKKILLVPGMSALMWENPMTKKQLTKIRRKWNWVQVLPPLLWNFTGEDVEKKVSSWEAGEELVDAVRNQVDLMNIGQDMEVSPSQRGVFNTTANEPGHKKSTGSTLPPELWTMIFDFTGDWELAQTLHIYTNLSPPSDWTSHTSPQGPRNSYMQTLELTILRGNLADVEHFIATHSVPPLALQTLHQTHHALRHDAFASTLGSEPQRSLLGNVRPYFLAGQSIFRVWTDRDLGILAYEPEFSDKRV